MFPSSLIDEMTEMVAELAATDRDGWSDAARNDELRAVLAARERFEAAILELIAQWDGRGSWGAEASTQGEGWLRANSRLGTAEVGRVMRSARFLRRHDRTRKALAAADVAPAHVDAVARVATGPRAELFGDHEETLLDAAVTTLAISDFETVTRRWRWLADDFIDGRDAARVHEARHLHLSPTLGGSVRIDGMLDPEGGAWLIAAIDRRSTPDPKDAPHRRSAAQRRADALVDLAREKSGGGSSAARTELLVHVDVETLTGIGRLDADQARCDLDGHGPVAPATIRRLACDATFRRIVIDARGVVLDVGRATQIVSPAQRRAVIARDRHCVFPGCERPARWSDIHHVVAWDQGGPTDLANLCLLCRRHHVLTHEGRWTLQSDDRGHWTAQPPTRAHAPP